MRGKKRELKKRKKKKREGRGSLRHTIPRCSYLLLVNYTPFPLGLISFSRISASPSLFVCGGQAGRTVACSGFFFFSLSNAYASCELLVRTVSLCCDTTYICHCDGVGYLDSWPLCGFHGCPFFLSFSFKLRREGEEGKRTTGNEGFGQTKLGQTAQK